MKKVTYLGLALFFVGLSCAFEFESTDQATQLTWLWTDHWQAPIILMVTALVFVLLYFMTNRRAESKMD